MKSQSVEAGYLFTDATATPWKGSIVAPGVEVKKLGAANGRAMQLVRFWFAFSRERFFQHIATPVRSSFTCWRGKRFRPANGSGQGGRASLPAARSTSDSEARRGVFSCSFTTYEAVQ